MKTKELTYVQAQERLEEIVREIEENTQDIDRLCLLLKEARELIAFCKKRLYKVEESVKAIMGEKENEVEK